MKLKIIKEPRDARRPHWVSALIESLKARWNGSDSTIWTAMMKIPDFIREFKFEKRKCLYSLCTIIRVETDEEKNLIWVIRNNQDAPYITIQLED